MCITKTEAWEHRGVLFPTEEAAIDAALVDLGKTLVEDHHGGMAAGLWKHQEALVRLLTRKAEIEKAKPKPTPPVARFDDVLEPA